MDKKTKLSTCIACHWPKILSNFRREIKLYDHYVDIHSVGPPKGALVRGFYTKFISLA